MIYSYKQRVGMSHVREDWTLDPGVALDWLQDAAMYHVVEAKCGPAQLEEENLGWVINCWDVYYDRPCQFLDTLTVSTWAHDFDRVLAHRNFEIVNSAGETCLRADTRWFLMELDKQMPVRIREKYLTRDMLDPALDLPPINRHVKLPEEMEARPALGTPLYAVDANRHMNNVWYVRYALEYLPEGFRLKRLRAEYVNSAHYGDRIYPYVAGETGTVWVDLRDKDGKSFVKLEFREA